MNWEVFTWVIVFGVGALVINVLGIYLIHRSHSWIEKHIQYFICFAAGVLIASPLIVAFPEAVSKNSNAGFAALVGFIFMFFSNKFIQHKTEEKSLAFGITAIQGIGIHSFMDGVIYAVTFSVSIVVGLASGVGLILHELAEGAITYSMLVKGGMKQKKAFKISFLVAGLTTPIGALIGFPLVSLLSDKWLGLALGFVVGVLIYISAAHLLPEANEKEHSHSHFAFILGILLALIMFFFHKH